MKDRWYESVSSVVHSLWVNGPWRITFEWIDGDACRVDLEQYR